MSEADQPVRQPGPAGIAAFGQYTQEATAAVRLRFRHELGLPYSAHPKQILDFYYPSSEAACPVLAFIHGGSFRGGTPDRYGFVGGPFLEHGIAFASLGYRLMPDALFPDSADDVETALQWLVNQSERLRIDPGRVFLAGHSAGAMLAAEAALRPRHIPVDLVKGLILISGFYDFSTFDPPAVNFESPRYTPRLADSIEQAPPETILIAGAAEGKEAVYSGLQALAAALRRRGAAVDSYLQAGADHFHAVDALALPDSPACQRVVRMIETGSAVSGERD